MPPSQSDQLRVFLVEDSADLREEIVFGLCALGLDVVGFGDSAELYRALAVNECDIVVIDVGLPGEDGFDIAKHLQRRDNLGLVFLTARAALDDRLRGLGLGADAYLVKPIDVRELAATLLALGRRLGNKRAAENATAVTPAIATTAEQTATTLQSNTRWTISPGDWALRNPQGSELMLSETERRFLKIMVGSAGQIVSRDALIDALAQGYDDYDPHRLDAVISRLRKRCEQAGMGSLPLQSIRGMGYAFTG